jgi:microcystin-dependent protein
MPLETANYISELNPNNPAHTDQLNQDDAHARLIKAALKATFPNFTSAALNSTQVQLDAAVTTVNTTGVSVLADTGVAFKTNTGDGVTNPVAGEVDVKAGGAARLKVTSTLVQTTVPLKAPGAIPIGAPLMWFEDTLPDSAFGTYVWANGQIIASANTVCPELLARWGSTFGGNGVTTMGVPDMREVVPVGKGTMGGTTARGFITTAVKDFTSWVIGAVFGESLHKLLTAETPVHNHTLHDPTHTHPLTNAASVWAVGGGATVLGSAGVASALAITAQAAATGITIDPAGGDGDHNNVQKSITVNWAIRIA